MNKTIYKTDLKTSDFDYFLPEESIAQTPLEPRDSSRLLCYSRETKQIEHGIFRDIKQYLKAGDLLVVNNTKVYPARIYAKTEHGGNIELLLLKRINYTDWEILVKPGKKAKIGTIFKISDELKAEIKDRTDDGGRIASFIFEGVFEDILSRVGEMPLPPYIKEKLVDKQRYNTVYCKNEGSAAAPTAGLHFTKQLIEEIKAMGVEFAEVELNVGLGTFRPVKAENIAEHEMHSEHYYIDQDNAEKINKAKRENRRVIAVGTTSVRTLESVADENGLVKATSGDTSIFIFPPYHFKCVDALITNFHLPKSTLLMLVSAFIGRDEALSVYKTAVEERYRFFSFGDACLFL